MDNKNNKNNPSYNAMDEMNNFGVLAATQSSTTTWSSTPSPPPFHIAQTPLYVRRCPFWSIHPDLLQDVNGPPNASDFDIESREGYPARYAYNNYVVPPSNEPKYFTHTTFVSQSPLKSAFDGRPSPSLLHSQSPQTQKQKQIQPVKEINNNNITEINPYDMDMEGDGYEYEYKYNMYEQINMIISDLCVAFHRMGINSTTSILIIIAIFIAIQLNQYNMIRDDNLKMNDLNYISVEDVLQLFETQQLNYDKKIKKLNLTMVQLIDQNSLDIAENKANNTNLTERIVSIQAAVKNKVNQSVMDYFTYQQRTNWISGVVNMPHIIPYSFNELANEDKDKVNINFNIFTAMKRGLEIYHNESKYGGYESKLRYTANIDISSTATPNTLQPNDCLQFNSSVNNRWIEISLIEKLIATQFEYIHIDKQEINGRDKNKSPKRFMLFGKLRGDREWKDIQVKQNKILPVDESVIKLELEMKSGIELMRIEYDINEGAKTTRLYRMRVHGEPAVYE